MTCFDSVFWLVHDLCNKIKALVVCLLFLPQRRSKKYGLINLSRSGIYVLWTYRHKIMYRHIKLNVNCIRMK